MRVSPPISNFTAGEWSRLMDGQVDLQQRQNACRTLENFVVMTQGGVTKRPGTQFIAEVKNSAKRVRLIPFQYSTTQAYVMELGDLYARFFRDKGQIVSGALPYEIGSSYALADIEKVRHCQDKDLMYLFHNNYPIQKLTRLAHDNWAMENAPIDKGPFLPARNQANEETGANLATHGDFEEDTDCVSVGTPVVQRRNNDRVYEKTYSRVFTADAADEGFSLALAETTTGKTYLVRFRVFTKAGSLRLKVRQGDASGSYNVSADIDGIPESVWMEYERYFTEAAGGSSALLEFLCADGESLDEELVANGGFEAEGDWYEIIPEGGAGTSTMRSNLQHHTGSWAWLFFGPGSGLEAGVRCAPFITETGKVYKINFWVRPADSAVTLRIRKGDNSGYVDQVFDELTPNEWNECTYYYEETAGGSAAWVGFVTAAPASNHWVDDVSVKEVKSHYYIDKVEVFEMASLTMTPGATTGNGVSMTASSAFFESGHIGSFIQLTHGETTGYARIVGVTSDTVATVDILENFGSTDATGIWREGAWSQKNGYPACGCFYEQRLMCAHTPNDPDGLWGSKTTEYENFEPGANAADSLAYKLQSDVIRWLATLGQLVVGTVNSEYRVGTNSSDTALTPVNIKMTPQGRRGSADAEAVQIGNSIVFVQRRGAAEYGKQLRELFYNYELDAYKSIDLTLFASHVGGSGFVRLALQTSPYMIVWAVTADGDLIGITHDKEQQVYAWHRHDVGGTVEDICVIPGANQDELWMVVNRTIGVETKRYIEVMSDFDFGDFQDDAFFVDSGLTYDGEETETITGLDHLEGESVAVWADGKVQSGKTVVSGAITLDAAASVVQVGLPYTAIIEPLDLQGGSMEGTSAGKAKRIHGAALYLYRTLGGYVGQDTSHLEELQYDDDNLFTGIKDNFNVFADWGLEARMIFRHTDPSPCTILSILPRFRTEDR